MTKIGPRLLTVAGMVLLAGCVTHEREVVHETPTTQEKVVVVDPHRTWWETYHHDQAYDREHALAEHRTWCDIHPADVSCEGWYHRE